MKQAVLSRVFLFVGITEFTQVRCGTMDYSFDLGNRAADMYFVEAFF